MDRMSTEEELLAQLDSIKERIAGVMTSSYPAFRKQFMLFDLNDEIRQVGVRLQQVRDGPRIQAELVKLDAALRFVEMERQFLPPSELLKERMEGFALFKHIPSGRMYMCNSLTMGDWQTFDLNEFEQMEIEIFNDNAKQYQRNKEALQNL